MNKGRARGESGALTPAGLGEEPRRSRVGQAGRGRDQTGRDRGQRDRGALFGYANLRIGASDTHHAICTISPGSSSPAL